YSPTTFPYTTLFRSKKLTAECREELAPLIQGRAIAWAVAWADAAEIDRINILQATFLAMRRAILGLRVCPGSVEVDGNRLPNLRSEEHTSELQSREN